MEEVPSCRCFHQDSNNNTAILEQITFLMHCGLPPLHPCVSDLVALLVSLPSGSFTLTFSSPLATLKASSTTLPAAMRDAVDVCDSFQVVSLSTYRQMMAENE